MKIDESYGTKGYARQTRGKSSATLLRRNRIVPDVIKGSARGTCDSDRRICVNGMVNERAKPGNGVRGSSLNSEKPDSHGGEYFVQEPVSSLPRRGLVAAVIQFDC